MFENFVSATLVFLSRDHTQEAKFLILTPISVFSVTLSSHVPVSLGYVVSFRSEDMPPCRSSAISGCGD